MRRIGWRPSNRFSYDISYMAPLTATTTPAVSSLVSLNGNLATMALLVGSPRHPGWFSVVLRKEYFQEIGLFPVQDGHDAR